MASIVLGPMLRYVDDTSATVWVETDAACSVAVAGHSAGTFAVGGHHYALVVIEGLGAGTDTEYDVRLDGRLAWPEPDSPFPASRIRTTDPGRAIRIVAGSCRVTAPHVPPWTNDKTTDSRGMGVDALQGLAARLVRREPARWPDLLLFLGDQVYADEVSDRTKERIRARRDTAQPPGEGILDFEEYTWLYQEAWSDPVLRWLLSTVPTAMIFDDHDIHDDWNTSRRWRQEMQARPWWTERIAGGLAAYWIYQHLGNLSPAEVRGNEVYRQLRDGGDGGALMHRFALAADAEADGRKGARWSYCRTYGRSRLVVIDSRCGRTLDSGRRHMVDENEWRWLDAALTGDVDHLLLATSLPYLLAPAIHHLEGFDEALAGGAWGRGFARLGEKLRQAADLEHWAAFRESFMTMERAITEVAAGLRGEAPATIVFLSGDVHYSYLAEASWPPEAGVRSRVYQAVASPIRNPVARRIQQADRFSRTAAGRLIGRVLARAAGVRDPAMTWAMTRGPWFENALLTVELPGRSATLSFDCTVPGGTDVAMETVWSGELVTELPAALAAARRT